MLKVEGKSNLCVQAVSLFSWLSQLVFTSSVFKPTYLIVVYVLSTEEVYQTMHLLYELGQLCVFISSSRLLVAISCVRLSAGGGCAGAAGRLPN